MTGWIEIGDRVFVRRYAFWDQNIGVVLGDDAALVIDTRMTPRQANEIRTDLLELTTLPVEIVIDTHGHSDHAFGNSVFRPATIWAHVGCGPFLERTGEEQRQRQMRNNPELAEDLRAVVIDLPDESFEERAAIEVGGRAIEMRFLGRGHTDHDIVVLVPGSGVLFAGDLLENGAVPSFGDSYPLDWPDAVEAIVQLVEDVVVPGHGDHGGLEFVNRQLQAFRGLAALGRRVDAGELDMDAAIALTPFEPYPAEDLRPALDRTLAQIRGTLN
jgi:glyoxylase-like metal-dependent hydrolase (beta-lactamase superfamily II)